MPKPHPKWALAATVVTLMAVTGATRLTAQSIGAQVILAHSDQPLLGDLGGGGVLLIIPLRNPRLSSHLEVERLTGSSYRTGIVCAGLIDPSSCPTERMRDAGRSTGAAVGLEYRLVAHAPVTLGVLARLRFADLHTDTRGTETGHQLSADKAVWGGDFGARLRFPSRPNASLSLELGGTIGVLRPIRNEIIYDGYTPFDEHSSMVRLWFGINWRVGSR